MISGESNHKGTVYFHANVLDEEHQPLGGVVIEGGHQDLWNDFCALNECLGTGGTGGTGILCVGCAIPH